jgi:RNA recognition motif-containing protein
MKLFVAKLNRDVTDDDLTQLFTEYGEVAYAKVVTDRETGASKCFGFVQFRSAEAANSALEAMNGEEFQGFNMVVKLAEERPRDSRPGKNDKGSFSRRPGTSAASPSSTPGSRHAGIRSPSMPPSNKDRDALPARKKKTPVRKGKDTFSDGPKTTKMKITKEKNRNWLSDLDDDVADDMVDEEE